MSYWYVFDYMIEDVLNEKYSFIISTSACVQNMSCSRHSSAIHVTVLPLILDRE